VTALIDELPGCEHPVDLRGREAGCEPLHEVVAQAHPGPALRHTEALRVDPVAWRQR
jgi:hypothetical protein